MKKDTVHLGSAHTTAGPARPSSPAPLGISARYRRNRGGGIPFDAGGLPAESGRPATVGRWGSSLGVTPVYGDPDLGRRAVGGSPWRAHGGDGDRWRGAPVRGVSRLSLERRACACPVQAIGPTHLRGYVFLERRDMVRLGTRD
jgi:hypothetical protein